jgi:hypothetical protein
MNSSPSDPILWRYMDIGKFVSLLSTHSLYLPAARNFPDRFEGTINQATYQAYKSRMEEALTAAGKKEIEFLRVRHEDAWIEIPVVPDDPAIGLHRAMEAMRARTYVSCWHENSHESEAMWRLYVPDLAQGIAIRTTGHLLNAALPTGLKCRKVEYMDYAGEAELLLLTDPFYKKRIAFAHEQEWRIIKHVFPPAVRRGDVEVIPLDSDVPQGISIPLEVSLSDVVTEARLSPVAPPWVRSVYEDLLKKYGVPITLAESSLATDPFSPLG